jgi:hypothetical protein
MVDELVDDVLALVHVVRVPEDFSQLEGGMLILLQLPASLALAQLDEALPCLGVGGLEFGGSQVCALGLVELVLLVQGKGEEDVSGGSAAALSSKTVNRCTYA